MSSVLAWLDHDQRARERTQRILELFTHREARDELGLGAIRDAFSDTLFPGTSVLQTRLRYFLFVPWMFRAMETENVSGARFEAESRRREAALIEVLKQTEPAGRAGVIGKRAGAALKTMPSAVYWSGLCSWGLYTQDGSLEDYFDRVDTQRARRRQTRGWTEAEDSLPAGTTWHPALPDAPDDFPETADFRLSRSEAAFLAERIRANTDGSLLAWLAARQRTSRVDFVWQHPLAGELPDPLAELVGHARLFSDTFHGAALLYNLMLAELVDDAVRAEEYRGRMHAWAEGLDLLRLRRWSLPRLWELTAGRGHAITPAARAFVENWMDLARRAPAKLASHRGARELIRQREARKGPRARLSHAEAREGWSGASAVGPMDFRWRIAQRLLSDLFQALRAR